jgi:Protein of unknown function (DUF2877)
VIELNAITLGYAVPRHDFNVTVHSVFPNAVNLQSRNARRLLTLVMADCADLPQGIRLATPPGFSFDMGLQQDERLVCRNGFLEDERKYLSIDLRQANHWKCHLPVLEANGLTLSVTSAWTSVWQALNERQRQTGAELCAQELFRTDNPRRKAVTVAMGTLIRALINASQSLEGPVEEIVAGLIGLGSGLTPTGDDFLVGFLTGLRCMTDKKGERFKFLSALNKLVIRLSWNTNDISRTYLYHAAHGQVSSKLATLIEAIATGEVYDRLLQIAEEAMLVGHSSGLETVTGLLVGFSTWGKGFAQI